MSRPASSTLAALASLAILALVASVALAAAPNANNLDAPLTVYTGTVVGNDGEPIRGATVSLFSTDESRSISVYSQPDGTYKLPAVPSGRYKLRVRLMGWLDEWKDLKETTEPTPIQVRLRQAEGWALQSQRPAHNLMNMMEWEDEKDALNFRMMCAYCHQVGTVGFRSPEEPVDWEVMLTRMDGFQGLYKHTQDVLVDKIVSIYGREAEDEWPDFVPPEPPSGESLKGEVREWLMGDQAGAVIHDLELGDDGLVYTVDMAQDVIETLDPVTGERAFYTVPGGKDYLSAASTTTGIHSIEKAEDGDMWVTLAYSGQMAEFDVETKEWRVGPGRAAPRPRGGYPHTLRFAPDGILWWTDAGSPSGVGVLSLDPDTWDGERWDVTEYKLPTADQVRGGGARGESRGVTPYGIDVAPNGHVFYSKLNGQRVGRIRPQLDADDPEQVVEWKPPVHGPRRLHVAPDGIVWVPGWASGDVASFNEETEEWKVYDLPHGPNSMPYALNINPVTGEIWITGTGTDSMLRFDPKTEEFVEYRMPMMVTYTREIEFDEAGNAWTTNSNAPSRHAEHRQGSVLMISAGGGE
ncbi:MAG: carboxypeptidase regulatory-like domain-containing protein [Acidobacteria bacterium]|nr:carboxypeptidase regulatory-like domain-containing protein [Acidobacteriota bacterium]